MRSVSPLSPHARRVCGLYRAALRTSMDWLVRDDWILQVEKLRAEFKANKGETDVAKVEELIRNGERRLKAWLHPDPYKSPTHPLGTKYERNEPPPPHLNDVSTLLDNKE